MWTRWCLGNRDPWLWAIFWILEGKQQWSRPALLAYWAALGSLSVAGWNRQLARSRKYRGWNSAGENLIVPGAFNNLNNATQAANEALAPTTTTTTSDGSLPSPSFISTSGSRGLTFSNRLPNFPNLPNLPNGANVANVRTDLLDAANKYVPTLKLNARRKFFHALAVVMFVPGLAIDVSCPLSSFSKRFGLTPSSLSPLLHISVSVQHLRCFSLQNTCGTLRSTRSVPLFTSS